jgi:hypothetical protein
MNDAGRVTMNDAGRVTGLVSEALAWRLEITSRDPIDSESLIFSIRPAAEAASEQPCGPGEICPAGYSVSATSRDVNLEPLRHAGESAYRQAVTVVMPLDLTWVKFFDGLHTAVAVACLEGRAAALAAGHVAAELRRESISPRLTFPLKAAVFAGGGVAEAEVVVALRCWGSGFSRDELARDLVPARHF